MPPDLGILVFVTGVSQLDVFKKRLLDSPCLAQGGHPLVAHFNAPSAAQVFNAAMDGLGTHRVNTWLVWVHQDVHLPQAWDTRFLQGLQAAQARFPRLAVVGVHGIAGAGPQAIRAGHVLDRGTELMEASPLPCLVDSVDELLFAVRADCGLRLDPALGWDFYGTDVVLQARDAGLQCAVVDGYCEHWSDTPIGAAQPAKLVQRILASAAVFEAKWQHHFPITTPCFDIHAKGDVQAFVDRFLKPAP